MSEDRDGRNASTESFASSSDQVQEIGPYRLVRKLGEGGMGEVYEAEQLEPLRRRVALKIIKRGMDSKQVVTRFEAERQALALMNHPNVAKVFDAGATPQGRPYFAMEHVQGVPITGHCDRHRLTTGERLELFLQVCAGVQHAHQKGIIHRDIKPSNVLVQIEDNERVPKIIDFGVAKATQQRLTERTLFTELGVMIGTPEYMSPEQAEMTAEDIDTRTDVYSLGVLLYELLTGSLPFDSRELRQGGFDEVRRRIREEEPPKPSTRVSTPSEATVEAAKRRQTDPTNLRRQLRGDLDWIVMKALSKDRTRRYGSPNELAADLARHLRQEPVLAGPPSTAYRLGKFVRRHSMGVGLAAVLLAVLIGFAATMTVQASRIARERNRANLEAETAHQVSDFLVSLFRVSDPLEGRGSTVTARELLDEGAVKIRRDLQAQPLMQARLMDTIGNVYQALGLHDNAVPLVEAGMRLREQTLGTESAEYARSLISWSAVNAVSDVYLDESLALRRRALEILRKELGENDVEVARCWQAIGNTLWKKGVTGEALPAFRRALAIFEDKLGAEAIDVAHCLNNIANVFYSEGDSSAALPLYERSLKIKEKLLGTGHPDVAMSLGNMGNLLLMMGELERAEPMLVRTLEIMEEAYGPEHTYTGIALHNVGNLLRQMNEGRKARPLLERAAAIQERRSLPDLAECLNSLALVLQDLGETELAEADFKRALEIREKVLGVHHPLVAETLEAYAVLLHRTGRSLAAGPLEDRARAIRGSSASQELGLR